VPSEGCSIEEQWTEKLWIGVLRPVAWCVASLDIIRPSTIFLSTAPQLSISQKALESLPEDGNVTSKYVGVTVHNL
jgi:hypothetical protein